MSVFDVVQLSSEVTASCRRPVTPTCCESRSIWVQTASISNTRSLRRHRWWECFQWKYAQTEWTRHLLLCCFCYTVCVCVCIFLSTAQLHLRIWRGNRCVSFCWGKERTSTTGPESECRPPTYDIRGLRVKMAATAPRSPSVQIQNHPIPDPSSAILIQWCHLELEFLAIFACSRLFELGTMSSCVWAFRDVMVMSLPPQPADSAPCGIRESPQRRPGGPGQTWSQSE